METQIRNKDVSIVKKETPQEEVLGESVLNERHFFDRSLTPNLRPRSRPRSRSAVDLERQPGNTWRRRGILLNPIWETKRCYNKRNSSKMGRLNSLKEYLSRPMSAASRPGSADFRPELTRSDLIRDVWTRDVRLYTNSH